MECNRETSADGTTSSAPPAACPNPDALVPCLNDNCRFFGCAATRNLCSKCYSELILKDGGTVFLNKPCDSTVDPPTTRLIAYGAAAPNDTCVGDVDDSSAQRIDDSSVSGSMVAMSSNESGLREFASSKNKSMNRSVGVSDLHAIFRSVETSSAADFPQQRMPSPLSLPSSSQRAFSPVRRQVETKMVLPPLTPRQQAVNRCLACRKRVGLLGFKCRCGDIFCSLHRYSDRHDCSFDYKAAGRATIAKENPVVKASKIEKI